MTGADLSAIELCVEDWKQQGQQAAHDRRTTRPQEDTAADDSRDGEVKDGDSPEASTGLELNSSAYKQDADPGSSQANNMAVAFELNL